MGKQLYRIEFQSPERDQAIVLYVSAFSDADAEETARKSLWATIHQITVIHSDPKEPNP